MLSSLSFQILSRRTGLLLLAAASLIVGLPSSASAQETRPGRQRRTAKPAEPEPRTVTLTTRDGVKLRAIYLESTKKKQAIPILLIHEWGGQASPYLPMAKFYQKQGFAVLIPEYRAHGGSRTYVDRSGREREFDPQRMGRSDMEAIVSSDLEAAKGFLKDENNDGKLNLNALVVIGVGEGAIFGATWTQRDWAFPSVGRKKQGQDVKAVIYVSPKKTFKGLAIDKVIRDPAMIRLPTMIVAGSGSDDAKEAMRLAKQIEATKKRIGRGSATGLVPMMQSNSLSGLALATHEPVVAGMMKFIGEYVTITDEINEWIERQ
ncbi:MULTISPECIES: alpha/beta hydrolase [Crateriforma]|uniref:Alpha/beta hydrolase family protein n=1 Tax=Crateriforma conspicua TaxID=2527996 RepID=A0A5C6FX62_9PLAN|nr:MULTISPECIES: alpha/beta hydrolase [Crateriforma]TWU66976.1 Alpha/beta hydrolase family protein [Crateriforma conspicua]